jgi:hypothetical protein
MSATMMYGRDEEEWDRLDLFPPDQELAADVG